MTGATADERSRLLRQPGALPGDCARRTGRRSFCEGARTPPPSSRQPGSRQQSLGRSSRRRLRGRALGRVPDELAHERRQLRLDDLKLAANPTVRSLVPKGSDLAVARSGCGKERGRGGEIVLLGKRLRLLVQVSHRRQIDVARVLHDVVEPLGCFRAQQRGSVTPRRGCADAQAGERHQERCAAGGAAVPRPRRVPRRWRADVPRPLAAPQPNMTAASRTPSLDSGGLVGTGVVRPAPTDRQAPDRQARAPLHQRAAPPAVAASSAGRTRCDLGGTPTRGRTSLREVVPTRTGP
jgi:hypothetical protein